MASGAGVSLSEAKKSLTALAQLADGHLEVPPSRRRIHPGPSSATSPQTRPSELALLQHVSGGDTQVSSDGQLIYAFGSVRATLLAKSSKARIMESWKKVNP